MTGGSPATEGRPRTTTVTLDEYVMSSQWSWPKMLWASRSEGSVATSSMMRKQQYGGAPRPDELAIRLKRLKIGRHLAAEARE